MPIIIIEYMSESMLHEYMFQYVTLYDLFILIAASTIGLVPNFHIGVHLKELVFTCYS